MTLTVREWSGEGSVWDAFVDQANDGTVCHLHAWGTAIEQAYGHRKFYLAAEAEGEIRGVLPLVLIESRVFGRNLVSMPFVDYGGPVSGGDANAADALVAAAVTMSEKLGATLSLRCAREQSLDLEVWLEKVTMCIELGTSEEGLWKRLPSERRNRIRKAQKLGVTASFHGEEALEDFYRVFATNMRDLGSPVHSVGFFRALFAHLGDRLSIVLVNHENHVIGTACVLRYKDTVTIPGWISSLRAFFHLCPNQLLHWELMRFAIAGGYTSLDLGRSSRDSGTFEAKRQWHAVPQQLYWYYAPHAPPPGGDQSRFTRLADLWRRLPLPVANRLGPRLRKSISN